MSFIAGKIEPRAGGDVTLIFNNATLTPAGEKIPARSEGRAREIESGGRIIRWDLPRALAFSWWGEPDDASEVAIELA